MQWQHLVPAFVSDPTASARALGLARAKAFMPPSHEHTEFALARGGRRAYMLEPRTSRWSAQTVGVVSTAAMETGWSWAAVWSRRRYALVWMESVGEKFSEPAGPFQEKFRIYLARGTELLRRFLI